MFSKDENIEQMKMTQFRPTGHAGQSGAYAIFPSLIVIEI